MPKKSPKLQRPDVHFDAILSLVGVLLGFLFIVVIYFLEYPHEALTTWGMPLIMFLTVCYALGLLIIGFIISYEINFYLANRMIEIEPDSVSSAKFTKLKQNIQQSLRRSIQMFLYFIFSFGLFLINLASFTASKFFYPTFALIEDSILLSFGPIVLYLIRFLVMFFVQLILIIPFANFQGSLWGSFKTIEALEDNRTNSEN